MKMRSPVQSYPPLGQVTVISTRLPVLTVVLEVPSDRVEQWQVSLWRSIDEGEWAEAELRRTDHELEPRYMQNQEATRKFLCFSGQLAIGKRASFTVKFRASSTQPWKWVRDMDGLSDGIIVLQSSGTPSDSLQPHIPDLSSEWKVTSGISQSPGTRLWSLLCPIDAANGEDSHVCNIDVGTPWGTFLRWFALVRHQPAWLAPRHGTSRFTLDRDAVLCCFLSHEGKTMSLLAVSDVDTTSATFSSTLRNTLSVQARNDSPSKGIVRIIISEGYDFEHAVASVMYEARDLVSPHAVSRLDLCQIGDLNSPGTAARELKWYDGLGYCTWNSLGQQLSQEKVLDAVRQLTKNGIHISNLIIDDNWQSLERVGQNQSQFRWTEFEADKQAFPNGLQNLITSIRKLQPDICHIFVWHAMLGYWGGISPNGAIATRYKTLGVRQDGKSNPDLRVIAKEDVSRLYDDFYSFLRDAGVDGVKTDAQVMVDSLKEAPIRRELISTYLDVWSKTSQKYFGKNVISCMSQFPLSLFHSQLPRGRQEIVVRNSDDYFPNEPASHPWHIWANAHNSIFTHYLNVVPDWDMFQTVHLYSEYHAAARCVSGAPIYITDVPGEHDIPLIKQISAKSPLGRTLILRPSSLGKSINHYEKFKDVSLLKIGSYHGVSQAGVCILGVFNVSAFSVSELLPLSSFPGYLPSVDYVVRAHSSGRVSGAISTRDAAPLVSISLDMRGYEILCAFPVAPFDGSRYGKGHAGLLGLTGKMTGCAALITSSILKPRTGQVISSCTLKALGILGVFISILPKLRVEDDFMVTLQDIPVPVETVRKSEVDCHVLEIDVELAWKLMRLSDSREDEVNVKCSFNV